MTDPSGEQELCERALQAANRLIGDLERDIASLAEYPEGQCAAQAAAEAARRVAKKLKTTSTEGAE